MTTIDTALSATDKAQLIQDKFSRLFSGNWIDISGGEQAQDAGRIDAFSKFYYDQAKTVYETGQLKKPADKRISFEDHALAKDGEALNKTVETTALKKAPGQYERFKQTGGANPVAEAPLVATAASAGETEEAVIETSGDEATPPVAAANSSADLSLPDAASLDGGTADEPQAEMVTDPAISAQDGIDNPGFVTAESLNAPESGAAVEETPAAAETAPEATAPAAGEPAAAEASAPESAAAEPAAADASAAETTVTEPAAGEPAAEAAADAAPVAATVDAAARADAFQRSQEERETRHVSPFRPYEMLDAEGEPTGTDNQSVRNFSMNGWRPINQNTVRLMALSYGGPENDPNFLNALDIMAADKGLSAQELAKHRGKLKFNQFATPENPEGEMDPQEAIYLAFKKHSALMARTDEKVTNLPLAGVMFRRKGALRTGMNALFHGDETDQQLYGADMMLTDVKYNKYIDNGRSVQLRLMPGQRFGGDAGLNLAAIHFANRLRTPAADGSKPSVRFCINTHKNSLVPMGRRAQEHEFNRDVLVLAALHEGEKAGVIPDITVKNAFGVEKRLDGFDYDSLNGAAVQEMEALGIDVRGLIDRYNNRGHEPAAAIEGDRPTPGQTPDAVPTPVPAAATPEQVVTVEGDDRTAAGPEAKAEPDATPAREPLSVEKLAAQPIGATLSDLNKGPLEEYQTLTAQSQAVLMVLDDELRTEGKSEAERKQVLSDRLADQDAFEADKQRLNGDPAVAEKRAIVDAAKGLGDDHKAVPPFMQIMEAEAAANGHNSDQFKALKQAALTVQVAARLDVVGNDPTRRNDFPAMRTGPKDSAEIQTMVETFNVIKEAKGTLPDAALEMAKLQATKGFDSARGTLEAQGLTAAVDRLNTAFPEREKTAPAVVADAGTPAAETPGTAPADAGRTDPMSLIRVTRSDSLAGDVPEVRGKDKGVSPAVAAAAVARSRLGARPV